MHKRNIEFTRSFQKSYAKVGLKVQQAFGKRLAVFLIDPFHALLNNHALTGKYAHFRSINITGDWRVIYSEKTEGQKTIATFHMIGTHSQLYK